MRQWKLEKMCDNCPFSEEGPGLQLRLSLHKKRWQEILDGLLQGQHFFCHKTTHDYEEDYEAKGGEKICAGARQWQKERGIVSDAEQIMSRIEAMKGGQR